MNKEELKVILDDMQGELEATTEVKDNLALKYHEILTEITNFCEECGSHECCPEEECVLYRIEKIIGEDNE